MTKKQFIYIALIIAPIAINAQSESKNYITFEPTFSVSVINYKYVKEEFFSFGTYYKNSPKSIGGKISFTMPKYFCGIALQYNYLPKVNTGYDYNYKALVPNDPSIPRKIEFEFNETQFAINPYFVFQKNKPIKFTIGPILTFIKNKIGKENLIMDNGRKLSSNSFSNEFNSENKTSTGAAISMIMTKKQFCLSLNSSLSMMNEKYFTKKQDKPAIIFQFGISMGYYLEFSK